MAAFLDRRIGFLDIAAVVAETLERMDRHGRLTPGPDDALESGPGRSTRRPRRVADEVVAAWPRRLKEEGVARLMRFPADTPCSTIVPFLLVLGAGGDDPRAGPLPGRQAPSA